jgi:Holliday junction resolvase RusA-like endonuclease
VIEFRFFAPDRRKRDLDNLKKLVCDGVKHGLGIDDHRFLTRDMSRSLDRADPRIELTFYPQKVVWNLGYKTPGYVEIL